ncbi:hypothetical protein SEA_LOZINAK_138 [Gordonia phage Lozinak]|uniref:Uncharacterized protein n=2 Tax=Smoothievirus smoothie TaxID=1982561 RepID=A0A2D1GGD4_9CAUD|nr:hypothetical protein BEN60_gp068 [Gordonia phage Smoothie]ANA86295.1 hypothetical protein PBI_SMOOTHIE_139 [Gordonia phage Smoothie]ATN90764.1 hypothetical protein SEA_LOZINAK_138 [Gordonia phage Lozinak]
MSEEEFLDIIGAKGGVFEALDYGLSADELEPGHLRDRWNELRGAWSVFDAEIQDFEDDFSMEDRIG